MAKKIALLMGINYEGTDSQLNGCINDVYNVHEVLISKFGYGENDIVIMTDHTTIKPTYKDINVQLIKLAERSFAEDLDQIFISYSGHGSYVHDTSGDEDDKRDECLVPLDYEKNGLLMDDLLNNILGSFNPETKVFFLIDACHSETMLDTKYRYIGGKKSVIEHAKCKILCNMVMLSGCQDTEYSSDAYNINNSQKYSGAMTTAFLYVLDECNYNIACWEMLKRMKKFLRERKFTQNPQICCTKQLTRESMLFSNGNMIENVGFKY